MLPPPARFNLACASAHPPRASFMLTYAVIGVVVATLCIATLCNAVQRITRHQVLGGEGKMQSAVVGNVQSRLAGAKPCNDVPVCRQRPKQIGCL